MLEEHVAEGGNRALALGFYKRERYFFEAFEGRDPHRMPRGTLKHGIYPTCKKVNVGQTLYRVNVGLFNSISRESERALSQALGHGGFVVLQVRNGMVLVMMMCLCTL